MRSVQSIFSRPLLFRQSQLRTTGSSFGFVCVGSPGAYISLQFFFFHVLLVCSNNLSYATAVELIVIFGVLRRELPWRKLSCAQQRRAALTHIVLWLLVFVCVRRVRQAYFASPYQYCQTLPPPQPPGKQQSISCCSMHCSAFPRGYCAPPLLLLCSRLQLLQVEKKLHYQVYDK